MSLLEEVYPAPVRERTLIFVIDMNEKVNGYAMDMTKIILEHYTRLINEMFLQACDDVKIRIAVLQYGGCTWVTSTDELIDINEFYLKDYSEHDMKGIREALSELNRKLEREALLKSVSGIYAPIIIFIGSGHTNENIDKEISELYNNKWYKHATKFAIMTDIKSSTKLFQKLTGNIEAVFDITQFDMLRIAFQKLLFDYMS